MVSNSVWLTITYSWSGGGPMDKKDQRSKPATPLRKSNNIFTNSSTWIKYIQQTSVLLNKLFLVGVVVGLSNVAKWVATSPESLKDRRSIPAKCWVEKNEGIAWKLFYSNTGFYRLHCVFCVNREVLQVVLGLSSVAKWARISAERMYRNHPCKRPRGA